MDDNDDIEGLEPLTEEQLYGVPPDHRQKLKEVLRQLKAEKGNLSKSQIVFYPAYCYNCDLIFHDIEPRTPCPRCRSWDIIHYDGQRSYDTEPCAGGRDK